MTNKEKFMLLVSDEKTGTLERISERVKNRAMLRESQKIAMKVLFRLDELEWTQKTLAIKLGVSPQQVNKLVSGKENLTLETIVKLQEVLDICILETKKQEDITKALAINFGTIGITKNNMFVNPNYSNVMPAKSSEVKYEKHQQFQNVG